MRAILRGMGDNESSTWESPEATAEDEDARPPRRRADATSCPKESDSSASRLLKIAFLRSLIPWPVVAETRRVCSGLIPRRKNSSFGRLSPRSDLFKINSTGLRDLRAFLAICLSLSSGYLELSSVSRITSALSIASAIWSWMPASKSSFGSLRPAVSMSKNWLSMRAMTLSRVVPSSRATMAIFLCARRLSRLDLPALV